MITYGLIDPRDGKIKYVGITKNSAKVRVAQHMSEALGDSIFGRPSEDSKGGWIAALKRAKLKPFLIKLADGNFERVIITTLSACGVKLYNKAGAPKRHLLTYNPSQERNPQ